MEQMEMGEQIRIVKVLLRDVQQKMATLEVRIDDLSQKYEHLLNKIKTKL